MSNIDIDDIDILYYKHHLLFFINFIINCMVSSDNMIKKSCKSLYCVVVYKGVIIIMDDII